MIEKISGALMNYIHQSLPEKTEEELEKIKYGIDIFLLNIYKIIILLFVAGIFHVLTEMILAMFSFGVIRMFASGLHMRKGWTCLFMTALVLFSVILLSYYIPLQPGSKLGVFLFSTILFFFYAPADTEEKPLINSVLRTKLKKMTLLVSLLFYILSMTVFYQHIIGSILIYSLLMESLLVTPVIYKIFRRRYQNYAYFYQEDFSS